MRLARGVSLAVCLIVISAVHASAERAWVLWTKDNPTLKWGYVWQDTGATPERFDSRAG